MFCKDCGQKLDLHDKFCPKCGSKNSFDNEKVITEKDHVITEKKDISLVYIPIVFGIYFILSLIIFKMNFFGTIGFALGPILFALPFVAIIYIIQMIAKVEHKKPIFLTVGISIAFFIMGTLGNLR